MTQDFSIETGGATLSGYRREGTGTPLVLVHGFGGSRHDWEPIVAALPADLPLIAYDQRGFGDSTGAPGVPFSHSDDLLALLDTLGIARADLCGLSLGGGTVLNFALNHPECVRRLVLVSPLMLGWSWSADWVERWKAIGRAARGGDIASARELWWNHPLFETTRESAGSQRLRAGIEAFHGRQWIQDDQRPELPEAERLTDLATPTLLLTGSHDTEDFRLMAALIDAASEQVSRIDHEGAGHLLNLEIPARLAGEIIAFVQNR
ncbi:alpha/beta fold hydrolase [Novosphingobium aerophilum]|uniref:alpha/beta fold hydrolase n=1 Tax=Novosphingobium TaxID=165696 RepID=UPI002D775102|nr:alpha/beta hydrolase [Novosphingobium sp. RL4]WRT92203.1 alpha/beta hydrolase [Novosphingobium sp. RL4]